VTSWHLFEMSCAQQSEAIVVRFGPPAMIRAPHGHGIDTDGRRRSPEGFRGVSRVSPARFRWLSGGQRQAPSGSPQIRAKTELGVCWRRGSVSASRACRLRLPRMRVRTNLLGRHVANCFDVVTIWIKDERPIIIRMIVRPQSWWPVISSPGRERFGVKRVHGFSILAGESDMGACLRLASEADPEEGFPVGSVAREAFALGI
jgi:hypothetical protein